MSFSSSYCPPATKPLVECPAKVTSSTSQKCRHWRRARDSAYRALFVIVTNQRLALLRAIGLSSYLRGWGSCAANIRASACLLEGGFFPHNQSAHLHSGLGDSSRSRGCQFWTGCHSLALGHGYHDCLDIFLGRLRTTTLTGHTHFTQGLDIDYINSACSQITVTRRSISICAETGICGEGTCVKRFTKTHHDGYGRVHCRT